MSENIVDGDEGYAFILTRFCGPDGRRMYQLNVGDKFVQLDDWQMLQLTAVFLSDHNREAMKANDELGKYRK